MKHDDEQVQRDLDRLADDDLPEAECNDLMHHLHSCTDCREAYAEELALSRRIRAARPHEQAPEGLRRQVSRLLAEEERRPTAKTRTSVPWQPWAWAASLLVTGFILLRLNRRRKAGQTVQAAGAARESFQEAQVLADIQTREPQVLTQRLNGRIPYSLQMANAGEASGAKVKWRLIGENVNNVSSDAHGTRSVSPAVGEGAEPAGEARNIRRGQRRFHAGE